MSIDAETTLMGFPKARLLETHGTARTGACSGYPSARCQRLAFFPLPQGVFHGNNSILWSEVSAITTGLDRVTIHRKDDKPWQIIPFGDISHALVFIALVDEMLESLRTPADRRAENSLDF